MIEKLAFGSTGHESSRTLFGAAAFSRVTQEVADRTLALLLQHGVNHIDVAASYGDAELRLARWLQQHRDEVLPRHEDGRAHLSGGARPDPRLAAAHAVEQIDLIQLHNLTDEADWQTAMSPGGALEAAVEAREQGLVRFIGVTGHGVVAPAMHARSLERFAFDSVLLPFNYPMLQNPDYARDFWRLFDDVPAARRGDADDQGHHARAMGREGAHDHDLVRAAAGPGRHRHGRALGARAAGRLPQHGRRRDACCRRSWTPRSASAASRTSDAEMERWWRRQGMAPLFV